MTPPPKKLLDQVRDAIRVRHYSYRTEEAYVQWIRRFILFHNKQHPKNMEAVEVEAFLTYLAVHNRVAASTQNQAFSALLFLYREVLGLELDESINAIRAKQPRQLPTVLTKVEVGAVIQHLSGVPRSVIQVLYSSGVRLNEGLSLRVKDLDFAQHQIIVRNPKGYENRVTMLPTSLVEPLKLHLERVQRAHQQDLDRGYGSVHLPFALERNYSHADKE